MFSISPQIAFENAEKRVSKLSLLIFSIFALDCVILKLKFSIGVKGIGRMVEIMGK